MPNSNSELTQPQNILQNRLKYLAVTLIISSIFIVLWGIFARLSVSARGVAFILPAFSVKPIVSSTDGMIKALSVDQSTKLHQLIDKVNTSRVKNSISGFEENKHHTLDIYNESDASSLPLVKNLPLLTEYLVNIDNLLEYIDEVEASSTTLLSSLQVSNSQKRLSVKDTHDKYKGFIHADGSLCYKKNDPVYLQIDVDKSAKIKQSVSKAFIELSMFKKNYMPLITLHNNEIQQNKFLRDLTDQAYALSVRKAISKNKFLDVRSRLLDSNKSLLSSLKNKQSLQVSVIKSYYNLFSSYVDFENISFLMSSSDICIIERIVPEKARVQDSELIALAIPSHMYKDEIVDKNLNPSNSSSDLESDGIVDIPFFYPANNDKGIKLNDRALIYPSNVPRNTFGGIKGIVVSSGRVLPNKSAVKWITGLTDISPYTSNSSEYTTMYYGIIRLNKANTATGYEWTSGKGPSYPILLGTAADVVVQVSTQSPISNILPTVRSVTGL